MFIFGIGIDIVSMTMPLYDSNFLSPLFAGAVCGMSGLFINMYVPEIEVVSLEDWVFA